MKASVFTFFASYKQTPLAQPSGINYEWQALEIKYVDSKTSKRGKQCQVRIEVTGWSRVEARGSRITFKANRIETYLTAEEVTRYDMQMYTEVNGSGFFRVRLDAHADMMYLSAGKTLLPAALREQIQMETDRQEKAKNQAEGSASPSDVLPSDSFA